MAAHEESLPSMVGVRVACHERLVFRKLTTELARDSGPGIAATWECPNLEHLLAVEVVFRDSRWDELSSVRHGYE